MVEDEEVVVLVNLLPMQNGATQVHMFVELI